MDEICNICLIERLNLTPLFRNTGDNVFRDTGLSKVVESSRGIKIDNINKSTSMICISCIYQSVVFYHDQFYQGNPPVTPDVLLNDSPNQSTHLNKNNQNNSNESRIKMSNEENYNFLFHDNDEVIKINHQCLPEIYNINNKQIKNNSINILNERCLAKIFMYLPLMKRLEMEEVCQKWKKASTRAWYDINKIDLIDKLEIPSTSNEEIIIKKILINCGPNLTHFNLKYSIIYKLDLMNIIENNFYNLVSLSLDMNPHFIDNYNWQKLLSKMIKLKYLKIIEGSPTSKTYADILNVLPIDMKEIHLIPGNYKILLMDDFIKAIEKFNEISNFTLQYCYLNNATIETITRKSKLIKLDLKGCEFERDSSEFANFNNLEYLNLESVKNINDKIIIRISKNCKNLKYLNLKNADNNYYSISSLALCEIGKLKNLEYLNLKNVINIDDDLISNTANRCEKLTYLDINLCTCLSSSTLNNLGKLKNLEYLNIRQLKINPNGIIGITNNCKNLKTLIMTSDNLTANDLQGIVKLRKMEYLVIKNLTANNGDALSSIIDNCKYINYLDIGASIDVKESTLLKIQKLEHLEKLILNHIINTTHIMFNNMYKLKVLSCDYCINIDDKCIIKIIDNCLYLKLLHLRKTKITIKTLIYAAEKTKKRTNDIRLAIVVDKLILKNFNSDKYHSAHLSVLELDSFS